MISLDELAADPQLALILSPTQRGELYRQVVHVEAELRALLLIDRQAVQENQRQLKAEKPREEYLSIRQLSQRLDYSQQTIRNLMTKGTFRLGQHYVKPRGRVMFKWSAVQAWLETGL